LKMNSKKLISLIAILLLIAIALCGCSNSGANQPKENMSSNNEKIRETVDMAGRKVQIPLNVYKIYCTSPVGTVAVYTLVPDKLVGWNYELSEKEKEFMPPKYRDLPVLGGWFSKSTGNNEEILKMSPDIIIHMSDIDETSISQADRIQEQIKIPVVVLDNELEKIDESYTYLGEIVSNQEQAKKLAEYFRTTIEEVKDKAKTIPEEKKVRVYYAEGPDGLETDPKGSSHTAVLDITGGINVAQTENSGGSGRLSVSIEQLLLWDPEIIISWDSDRGGYYDEILKDNAWKNIKAVQEGEVYTIPNQPFNWFDRPYSVNRILGLKWLSNLLYPDVFDYDIGKEVKHFYELFYHYELGEDELNWLLKDSTR